MSFALVLKKTSWYRRRYSRPLRVKVISQYASNMHDNKQLVNSENWSLN